MKEQQHIFTNKMLRNLLVPVIFEQVLNSLMGTVDTMMVSNVGSAAISAVSLVDSINVLVIQAFSALAAGGAIICSQYIGQKNHEMANKSARQVLFIITAISVAVTALCLAFRMPLLQFVFGKVEADVMNASRIYFFYTALSFPFIALYDAGASIFRFQGNTRCTDGSFGDIQCTQYQRKRCPDLGISYGSGRSCHCDSGIQDLLCSGCTVATENGQTADRGKRLLSDTSGWKNDHQDPFSGNPIRSREQHVSAGKTCHPVFCIYPGNGGDRSPGHDQYPGEP